MAVDVLDAGSASSIVSRCCRLKLLLSVSSIRPAIFSRSICNSRVFDVSNRAFIKISDFARVVFYR